MRPVNDQPTAEFRSFHRAQHAPNGIGACPWDDITEPDRDGLRLTMILADGGQNEDGTNRHRWIEVQIARLRQVDFDELERAVERRAGNYPNPNRLMEMGARHEEEPLVLHVEWCSGCHGRKTVQDARGTEPLACVDCAGRGYFLH
jgi:hypothetical protein